MTGRILVLVMLVCCSITDLWKRRVEMISVTLVFLSGLVTCIAECVSMQTLLPALLPGILLLAFSLLTDGRIGMGDGLVLLAMGFWTEAIEIWLVPVLALAMAAVAGMLFLRQRREAELPFVPFLLAADLLLLLLG